MAAADEPGFYLRADLGREFPENSSFGVPYTVSGFPVDGGTYGKARIGSSPWMNAGVGYDTGHGFRVDGNLSYFTTSLSGRGAYTWFASVGRITAESSLSSTKLEVVTGLANGYVEVADFFPATFRHFHPYFGGGLGVARIDVGAAHSALADSRSFSDINFAWDAVAGIGLPLSDRLSADLMYAYTDLGRIEGGRRSATTGSPGRTETFGPLRTDLSYHRVSLGLRLALGGSDGEDRGVEAAAGKPQGFYLRGDLGAGILPGGRYRLSTTERLQGWPPLTRAADGQYDKKSFMLPAIGFGYDTGRGLRMDETVSYFSTALITSWRSGQSTDGVATKFGVLSALSNLYVEFADIYPQAFGLVRPYVGAGVGLARIQMASSGYGTSPTITLGSATRTNFAWDAVAGIELPLTGHWTADVMYSYLDPGRIEGRSVTTPWGTVLTYTTTPLRADPTVHRVSMGLRYSF